MRVDKRATFEQGLERSEGISHANIEGGTCNRDTGQWKDPPGVLGVLAGMSKGENNKIGEKCKPLKELQLVP